MHIGICTAANARVCTVQVHALQHTVDGDGSSGPCSAAARLAAHVHVRQRQGLNFLQFCLFSKNLRLSTSRKKPIFGPFSRRYIGAEVTRLDAVDLGA